MGYLEQHAASRQAIKGGWVMVFIANIAFVLLTL